MRECGVRERCGCVGGGAGRGGRRGARGCE